MSKKSFNKVTFYESICYGTKKNKSIKYNNKKFYRYFYLKSAALDYIKYNCENINNYKIFEVNIYKHTIFSGNNIKELIYKKIFK